MSTHESHTPNTSPEQNRRVRASELLRARKLWLAPLVIASELVFWAVVGLAITSWYDRHKLDRISPDILSYVGQVIERHPQPTGASNDRG